MALDYGERRVGVAVSDPEGVLALPLETIERDRRGEGALARLEQLVSEYQVDRIVVGLPLHLDGRAGEQAERARAFGRAVGQRTGARIEYLDERWTSLEAERLLAPAGASKRRRQQRRMNVDTAAATILLRTWLERRTA